MQNIHIITYGCSNNQAESEIMAGLLTRSDSFVVHNIENADIIIINTCAVKEPTEKRIIDDIKKIQQQYPEKKLIIAGCMPESQYDLILRNAPKASMLGTHHIDKIVDVVMKLQNNKRVEILGHAKKCEKLMQPRINKSKTIHIVPIASGCLSACSYCITKIAKGDLVSYPAEKIIKEIDFAKKAGCKEFWLTAQDCGCYDYDLSEACEQVSEEQSSSRSRRSETSPQTSFTNVSELAEHERKNINLAKLIKKITASIKGEYRIRVGMINPKHLKNYYAELIDAYADGRVFRFLHLPIQSGSNDILQAMNRGYDTDEFVKIISAFRNRIPEIQVRTDVIIGFPGETNDDFEKTMQLIKEIKPDFVNVSKFGARPGTAAAKMPQLDNGLIKERSIAMTELVQNIIIEQNRKWLGWSGKVLIDEYNKEKQNFIARNPSYKPVIIKTSKKLKLGDFLEIRITKADRVLIGNIC